MTAAEDPNPPRFILFGDIGIRSAHGWADIGGPKPRTMLAVLLLDVGRVVALDRTIDAVWGDDPPARPEASLRGYATQLRRALPGGASLRWRSNGYVLHVEPDDVDVHRFERLAVQIDGHLRDGRHAAAGPLIEQAARLRTGRPFAALADEPAFIAAAVRLDERFAHLEELAIDVRLADGAAAELVPALRDAVASAPYRERRREQLALALHRAGRSVDALRSIDQARAVLRDEVGVDPGADLIRLQHQILDHDPSLVWRPHTPTAGSTARTNGSTGTDRSKGDELNDGVGAPSFVGRATELHRIRAAIAGGGPAGAVIIVSGPAGIGKTSLVRAATTMVGAPPAVWARGRPATADVPYGTWAAIGHQLAVLGIADQVRVTIGDEPLVTRVAIAAAVRGARGRFVLAVDDLQWCDAASLEVLGALAGELPTGSALVATLRTDEPTTRAAVANCLDALAHDALRVELGGLQRADVGQWLAGRPDPMVEEIYARSAGHPFFIEALVALTDSDSDGARAGLTAAAAVPAAVHDVVRRRVSQLPASTQRLLTTAAVVGERFDLAVLAGVAGEPTDEVLDALDPAVIAGLLTRDPATLGRLSFAHGIVAEALRAEMSPARRARTHATVTEVLALRWAGDLDAVIDELAVHAHAGAVAGTAAAAVQHGRRAAVRATRANAPADAAAHLERALDALRLSAPGDGATRLELLTDLGTARAAAGDAMAGRQALVAAARLADDRADVRSVVRAVRHVNGDDLWSGLDWSEVDDATIGVLRRALDRLDEGLPAERAELLAALSTELYALDGPASLATAQEAVDLAGRVGDPLLEARVLLRQCWAAWRPAGQPVRAAAGDRLVALATAGALPARFVPIAHLTRFTAAYEVGDAPVLDEHLAAARASADPLRTPAEWTYLRYAEWSVLVARGAFNEAALITDGVYAAMRRSRPNVAGVTRAGLRVQVAIELGRTDDALAALADLAATPYAATASWWRAWALARAGRLEDVPQLLHTFDGPLRDDWYRAPLLCAALHAAVLAGEERFAARHVEVLRPLHGQVAIAGSGGLVLGPVALTLARVDRLLGNDTAADHALQQAEIVATSMRSPHWLAQIDAERPH